MKTIYKDFLKATFFSGLLRAYQWLTISNLFPQRPLWGPRTVPTVEQSCPAWTHAGSMTFPRDPAASVTWVLDIPVVGSDSRGSILLLSFAIKPLMTVRKMLCFNSSSILCVQSKGDGRRLTFHLCKAVYVYVWCSGPVHLIPSLCCDESCSLGRSQDNSPFQSQMSLSDGWGTEMWLKFKSCNHVFLTFLKNSGWKDMTKNITANCCWTAAVDKLHIACACYIILRCVLKFSKSLLLQETTTTTTELATHKQKSHHNRNLVAIVTSINKLAAVTFSLQIFSNFNASARIPTGKKIPPYTILQGHHHCILGFFFFFLRLPWWLWLV